MKPHEVRLYHVRDWPWRQVWCARCGRSVPWFHEHLTKPGESLTADHPIRKDT